MQSVLEIVGSQSRHLRQQRLLSPEDLAARIGITGEELVAFEKAVNAISLDKLLKLSSALGVPISRLFTGDLVEK